MTHLQEQLVHEVERLDESDLRSLAQFISFLKFRAQGADEDARFWQGASASALDAVWDNPEDDVYGELLKA